MSLEIAIAHALEEGKDREAPAGVADADTLLPSDKETCR
jgi:hypothetical protein